MKAIKADVGRQQQNSNQHILTASSHIKFITEKDDKIVKAIWLQLWQNSHRRDMSIRIKRHFWTAGRGSGGVKGRERWGGKGKLSVRWLPHAILSPPCCWPAHLSKMQKTGRGQDMMIHPTLSYVFSLVLWNCAM